MPVYSEQAVRKGQGHTADDTSRSRSSEKDAGRYRQYLNLSR